MPETKTVTPLGFSTIELEIQDILSQKNAIAEAEQVLNETYKDAAFQIIEILKKKNLLSIFRNFMELKTITDESRNKEVPVLNGFNMLESVIQNFIWRSMQEDNRVLSALFFSEIPKSHVWLHLDDQAIKEIIRLISEQTSTHGFYFNFIKRTGNIIYISAKYDFETKHAWLD